MCSTPMCARICALEMRMFQTTTVIRRIENRDCFRVKGGLAMGENHAAGNDTDDNNKTISATDSLAYLISIGTTVQANSITFMSS